MKRDLQQPFLLKFFGVLNCAAYCVVLCMANVLHCLLWKILRYLECLKPTERESILKHYYCFTGTDWVAFTLIKLYDDWLGCYGCVWNLCHLWRCRALCMLGTDLLHSLTTQRHAFLVTHKCLVTACVLDFLAFLTSVSLRNKLCRLQIIATMIEVTSEEWTAAGFFFPRTCAMATSPCSCLQPQMTSIMSHESAELFLKRKIIF